MKGVSESLRVLAEERDQDLVVDVDARVGAECDAAILRQGITNVLYNAIKYTPTKGTIRVAAKSISSGEAVIEILDNGPGISAPHRERIFERFYRADDARARETGGIGLGLAIARWAVEANGGRIEVDSDEGHGALFRIVLPAS